MIANHTLFRSLHLQCRIYRNNVPPYSWKVCKEYLFQVGAIVRATCPQICILLTSDLDQLDCSENLKLTLGGFVKLSVSHFE